MAHYAFLDENNVVTHVIVGKDEGEDGIDWEAHYTAFAGQTCKRTSFNTRGGMHRQGGTPFRKNFAGAGFIYDAQRDAFIGPKPYPSWSLDEETCQWAAPLPRPTDGANYTWDDDNQQWVTL